MNVVKILCALTLLMALVALPLRAQQQGDQAQSFTPTSGTDAVSPSPRKDYPLGPGDVVELRVFGEPQFDGSYDVDADGRLTIPFIEEPIEVRCRNVDQVRKEVVTSLARFLRKPQVYMRVREQHSRPAAVVYGAVRMPLQFQMHRRARLLELISLSGGVTEQSSGTIQITHREAAVCPEPDEVTEGKSDVQDVDVSDYVPFAVYRVADLKLGKPEANPYIRPGDIIYVAEASPVYIVGAVVSPQGIYLHEHLSLTTALAMVGGPRKDAKTTKVIIHRQRPDGSGRDVITTDFRKIQHKEQADVELLPYDVIEVPEKGLDWMSMLRGFATNSAGTVVQGAAIRVLY